jgi:hypothetical protein
MTQEQLDKYAALIIEKMKDIHENPFKYLKSEFSEAARKIIKDKNKMGIP